MRRVDWFDYKKNRSSLALTRAPRSERGPDRRRRDDQKRQLLSRLDAVRWSRWLESGRLEQTGPRRFRIHPEQRD